MCTLHHARDVRVPDIHPLASTELHLCRSGRERHLVIRTSEIEDHGVFSGHLPFLGKEPPPSLWVPLLSLFVVDFALIGKAAWRKNPARGDRGVKSHCDGRWPRCVSGVSNPRLAGFQLQSTWLVFQAPLFFEWKKAFCLNPDTWV